MNQKTDLLLIFVKHPVAGKAKTRLAADIGHAQALAVYRELLAYTQDVSLPISADKEVWYGNQMPEQDLWSEAGFARFQQEGESLGARMEQAFQQGFAKGYERIVIIGSDCATLTSEILTDAFQQLHNNDVVIGPATDGGYYLLGMTQLHAHIFHNKTWSTESVLSDTIADLTAADLSFSLLSELSDVDTVEDLAGTFLEAYMKEHPSASFRTGADTETQRSS